MKLTCNSLASGALFDISISAKYLSFTCDCWETWVLPVIRFRILLRRVCWSTRGLVQGLWAGEGTVDPAVAEQFSSDALPSWGGAAPAGQKASNSSTHLKDHKTGFIDLRRKPELTVLLPARLQERSHSEGEGLVARPVGGGHRQLQRANTLNHIL